MKTLKRAPARVRQIPMCLLPPLLLVVGGCGDAPTAAPVDPALARQTLDEVLESWRGGTSIGHWKTRTPPVVVQDADWQSGQRLVDFERLGPGQPQDANLLCPVRLTLAGDNSRDVHKEVVFIVGTDPVLTVFRDPFSSP